MWIVPESAIGGLVDDQSAFDAVEATFRRDGARRCL